MAKDFFNVKKGLGITPRPVVPSSPQNGDIYFDQTSKCFKKYQQGQWVEQRLNYEEFTKQISGKDANGIFTTVEWFSSTSSENNTPLNVLRKRSQLSGTSPEYSTRTVTYYDEDGTTILLTQTYNVSYDIDGDFIGEELQ
jgi:hypothetical protein